MTTEYLASYEARASRISGMLLQSPCVQIYISLSFSRIRTICRAAAILLRHAVLRAEARGP
jgi:hypothetical protein